MILFCFMTCLERAEFEGPNVASVLKSNQHSSGCMGQRMGATKSLTASERFQWRNHSAFSGVTCGRRPVVGTGWADRKGQIAQGHQQTRKRGFEAAE
jgi:hypothetical protein